MEEPEILEARKQINQKCAAYGAPTIEEMMAFTAFTCTEREYRAFAHAVWSAVKAAKDGNPSPMRQRQLRERIAKRQRAFSKAVLEATGFDNVDEAIAAFREIQRRTPIQA